MSSSSLLLAPDSPKTPTMTAKELASPTTLPTPPNTSHRTKRHQRRVTWTPSFSYHVFSPTSFSSPSRPSSPVKRASTCNIKPILKSSPLPFAYADDCKDREQTPPPPDAASSSTYLSTPLSTILSPSAELRDLVNAYSVLTARLRTAFTPTDAAADKTASESTPTSPRTPPTELLQPLRENAHDLVKAMTRDLGRVMVDPFERAFPDEESGDLMDVDLLDNAELCLPSPQSTPVKPKGTKKAEGSEYPEEEGKSGAAGAKKEKKRGMSAERVTYARDLCTTTHAVLRLLQLIFTEPLLYTPSEFSPFSDEDLHALFRGVIQIPYTAALPTPNARKSHALAVMTIQINTLPPSVLSLDPSTPFMLSSALLRAIRGQLGKEGKRGARGDGMRAIHNLSTATPQVYLPAFVEDLLPALLKSLTDPSLIVRSLAAHALGGVALGLTKIEDKEVKMNARSIVTDALNATVPAPCPQSPQQQQQKENVATPKPVAPPVQKEKENPIFVALKTTLNATEPLQPAQGPAWALSVIASLLLCLNKPVAIATSFAATASPTASPPETKIARLLVYGMRHKKSTVRALVGIVWRVLVYLAFKDEGRRIWLEDVPKHGHGQGSYWSTLKEYVDSSVGVSMVASAMAVLDPENVDQLEEDRIEDEGKMEKVLDVLACLVTRGEFGANDTIGMMKRLFAIPNSLVAQAQAADPKSKQSEPFVLASLLSTSLFSPLPGLLSMPYDSLHEIVNEILETQVPGYAEVPALTASQMSCIAEDGVWEKWVDVWSGAVTGWLEKGAKGRRDKIKDFVNIWRVLLKARVTYVIEKDGDVEGLAAYATGIISGFADVPGATATVGRLTLLRSCWTKLLASIPIRTLASSADKLFTLILHGQDDLVSTDPNGGGVEGKKMWAGWCAEVIAVCADPAECVMELFKVVDEGDLTANSRMEVWRTMGARYINVRGPWEGALALLDIPLDSSSVSPEMIEKDDISLWEKTVTHIVTLSSDNGVPSSEMADIISTKLSSSIFPTFEAYAPRLTDVLLSSAPSPSSFSSSNELAELVNQTLLKAYPPKEGTSTECRWMIRSLIRFFLEECELGCVLRMCEGAATWIEDAGHIFSDDDWEFDMLPLYEHFMLRFAQLPPTHETLKMVGDFILSGFQRGTAPSSIIEAFQTLWSAYSGDEVTEEIERCLWAVEHQGVLPPVPAAAAITLDTSVPEGEDEVLPPSSPILESPQESDDEDEWTIPEDLVLYDQQDAGNVTTPITQNSELPSLSLLEELHSIAPTTPVRSSTDLPAVEEVQAPSTPIRSTITFPTLDDEPTVTVAPEPEPEFIPTPTTPIRSTATLPPAFVFPTSPNPTTPKKPKSPFTPRTPVTPKSTVKDKENVSPTLPRRISSGSFPPANFPSTPSLKRKKDAGDEAGRRRTSLKKPRFTEVIDLTRVDEEEEEQEKETEESEPEHVPKLAALHQAVESASTSSTPTTKSSVPATPRKRAFMDAVEVPRVEEVFGPTLRKLRPLPKRMEALRKTASAPTPSPKAKQSPSKEDSPGSDAGSPMKRRRRSKFFPADLPILPSQHEELDIPASDDSIILARERRKSKKSVSVPSSDDDPRVGQVTPHHLISPAPRRRRRMSSLAPLEAQQHESDDEHDIGPPSSPTRQVALRRSMRKKKSVERLGSF